MTDLLGDVLEGDLIFVVVEAGRAGDTRLLQ